MNRRELIKNGLLGLGAAVALSGCDKEQEAQNDKVVLNDNNELTIIPKQTGTFEFSAPLPFNNKTIDDILKLNTLYKKSKITSLYNNLPQPFTNGYNEWLQISRGENTNIKSYSDFGKFVKRIQDNGIKFVYLMNSPKPFSEKDFFTFKDDFLRLLDFLKSINCKDIKISNTQVADIIEEFAPGEFDLSASTVFEFHNIAQYENLFDTYPNFKLIDLAYDENQNFKFINSLKKRFPKVKIEVMVNESCIKGCPSRIAHMSEYRFCVYNCRDLINKIGYLAHTFKRSTVYPWNLEYYSALGINNFKYIAYGPGYQRRNNRCDFWNVEYLKKYLDMVENYDENMSASDFILGSALFDLSDAAADIINNMKDMTVKEFKKYIPNIEYFVKNGDKCANRCRVECNYCYDCAQKLNDFIYYEQKA